MYTSCYYHFREGRLYSQPPTNNEFYCLAFFFFFFFYDSDQFGSTDTMSFESVRLRSTGHEIQLIPNTKNDHVKTVVTTSRT